MTKALETLLYAPGHSDPLYPFALTHSKPKQLSALLPLHALTHFLLTWSYGTIDVILFEEVLHIHTPLATGWSTQRPHDVPPTGTVPKGVAERSGGDHMKQVLSTLFF